MLQGVCGAPVTPPLPLSAPLPSPPGVAGPLPAPAGVGWRSGRLPSAPLPPPVPAPCSPPISPPFTPAPTVPAVAVVVAVVTAAVPMLSPICESELRKSGVLLGGKLGLRPGRVVDPDSPYTPTPPPYDIGMPPATRHTALATHP